MIEAWKEIESKDLIYISKEQINNMLKKIINVYNLRKDLLQGNLINKRRRHYLIINY